MGEGMAYGSLPFPGTGSPVLDIAINHLLCNDWCMGYCFTYIHKPKMF